MNRTPTSHQYAWITMLHDLANIRELPANSTVLQRSELGIATFERIRAEPGTFTAKYGEYAIVFANGPISGHVTLNGSLARSGSDAGPLYSVLRPGDRIAGMLEKPVTYEILLLSSPYVNAVLAQDNSMARGVLVSKLRVEAPRFMQLIWRCVGNLANAPLVEVESRIMLCIELLLLNLVDGPAGSMGGIIVRQHNEALRRASQFIELHLADPIKLVSIARVAGLSAAHFNRLFKAHHHVSVHRFVLLRRLDRVRQLLRSTNQPIAALALEAGFSSQSHLTSAFRRQYAMTPAQYRADSRRRQSRGGA